MEVYKTTAKSVCLFHYIPFMLYRKDGRESKKFRTTEELEMEKYLEKWTSSKVSYSQQSYETVRKKTKKFVTYISVFVSPSKTNS